MLIYIARHGKAEATAPSGLDRDRTLKPRGQRQAQHLGRVLAGLEQRPSLVLASVYERARLTAELVNRSLNVPIEYVPELECDRPVSDALRLIRARKDDAPLLLVGHNPQLSELVGMLVHGIGAAEMLRTGEMVEVRIRQADAHGTGRIEGRHRAEDETP